MAVRNPDFYVTNSSRSYPIDDSATLMSDSGEVLPNDIIVDANILFPSLAAKYAFIGSITVGPKIVTITVLGSNVPAASPTCGTPAEETVTLTPLGAVTIANPVAGRHYALTPLYPGVGGWLVLGPGISNKTPGSTNYYSGRFQSVSQTMLTSKAARSYRELPVISARKSGLAASLTGLVRLKSGTDLEIVKETRTIQGESRDAAVFRLINSSTVGSGRNIFDLYRGPCSQRPESNTCDGPPPVEQLNSVVPDCCGRITINFTGCADVTPISGGHGVVVDCGLGLIDVCITQDKLPSGGGVLPNERSGECP